MSKYTPGVPVTLWASSIDAQEPKKRTYRTLRGAQQYAYQRVGVSPTLGSYYAVSDDGVCKIECEGCTLEELFPLSISRF